MINILKETTEDDDEASNELAPIDNTEKKKIGIIGGPEDDLTLRAFFYCVLFQSYADKVMNTLNYYILFIVLLITIA